MEGVEGHLAVLNLLFPAPSLTLLTCINSICSGSTLKAGGSRLSQREEDVTHDSGTTDPGGGDNIEDAVYIMAKVFLWRGAEGQICQIIEQPQNKQTNKHACLLILLPCLSPGSQTL